MKKTSFLITPMVGIGDVLMTTPAIELIKKHLPDSTITCCTLNKGIFDLLKSNPDIDHLVNYPFFCAKKLAALFQYVKEQSFRHTHCITFYPSNRIHYNIVSLLTFAPKRLGHTYLRMNGSQGNWLKNCTVKENDDLHCVEENVRILELLGITIPTESIPRMKVILDKSEILHGVEYRQSITSSPCCIGVHAGTSVLKGHIARRWPKEYFSELVNSIQDAHFLLFGTKEELEANQYIVDNAKHNNVTFVSNKSIRDVAAIIKACNFFLSNDSGLMHLASAVNRPVLSLIGPTNPVYIRPWGVDYKVVSSHAQCAPCFRYSPRPLQCSQKMQFHCLSDLTPSNVERAVRDFMEKYR